MFGGFIPRSMRGNNLVCREERNQTLQKRNESFENAIFVQKCLSIAMFSRKWGGGKAYYHYKK